MKRYWQLTMLAAFAAVFCPFVASAAPVYCSQYVVDHVGILSDAEALQIGQRLARLQDERGYELHILIVDNSGGVDLREYTRRRAQECPGWQGSRSDNGMNPDVALFVRAHNNPTQALHNSYRGGKTTRWVIGRETGWLTAQTVTPSVQSGQPAQGIMKMIDIVDGRVKSYRVVGFGVQLIGWTIVLLVLVCFWVVYCTRGGGGLFIGSGCSSCSSCSSCGSDCGD